MAPPPADERPLVLLAQPLFPEFAAALAGRYRFALLADADAAAAAEARVLLVPGLKAVTAEDLGRLPAVELVAATSVGVDHVDLDACRRRGLSVTNAGAAFSVDSADYAVGLVVAVLRRVVAAEAFVRSGRWAADGDYPLVTKAAASEPLVLLADPIILEFELELSARYRLVHAAEADVDAVASVRALLTMDLPAVTVELIGALPKLGFVVASSIDVDHIDLAACRRCGLAVTNAGDAFSADAADYAVGLLVAALRHVAAADTYVWLGRWPAGGEYPLAAKVD